jgi:signal transduction histidine kinase
MIFFREIRFHFNHRLKEFYQKIMIARLHKFFFIFLLSASSPISLLAQNKFEDSLKNVLKTEKLSDSVRVGILLQLGWNYSLINTDSARLFLDQALYYSKKIKDINRTGQSYNYIGTNFLRSSDYDSALFYYSRADSFYKKAKTKDAEINLPINKMAMAAVKGEQGNQLEAIEDYLEGIDSLRKYDFPEKWDILVSAYTNIGNVYNEINQFKKMLEYDLKALEICNNQNIPEAKTAQIQLLTSLAYIKLKRLPEAFDLLKKNDSLSQKINSPYIFCTRFGIIGRYYKTKNNSDSAIAYYNLSLKYARDIHNKFQETNMLQEIGIIYFEKKEYTKSSDFLKQSLAVSQKIGDKKREVISLKYLSEILSLTNNDHEAVKMFKAYVKLKDSLDQSANLKKINEIENRYQAERKQAQILALQKDNLIQQSTLKQRHTVIISLIAGCILLLFVALLFYKNSKNKNRLLLQNEKLHQQQLSELEKERKLEAAEYVMKGQEEERSRLARDLHDGVGGLLSGVKLSMSNMKGNVFLTEENAQSFNNVITQLDQSIAELRRVSHNMMPEALIKFGLKEALENYCESLNLSGNMKVQLQTYGMEKRMDQSTEIVIYRIIQELLNNVIKHADAKNVLIQLSREQNRFNLTVEDDGKGFDLNERASGAGLANIKARAEYLNGNVDIVSKKGEGTSVNIEGECGQREDVRNVRE